jgi:hypothetical protein
LQNSLKNFRWKCPYLTFENKLIQRHESTISRTTDFSPNTPIRLLFSGFIHLYSFDLKNLNLTHVQ